MIAITPDQIRAARDNDLDAVREVLAATEERVCQLAYRASTDNPSWREDAEQIGREQVWLCIREFSGNTTAEFFAFMENSIRGALANERRLETRPGVSREASHLFEAQYKLAKGDLDLAERLCTELPAGRRLSPELARVARVSFEGQVSFETPRGENLTLGDMLAEVPDPDVDEIADESAQERRETTRRQVRDVLSSMGETQRIVVSALTGVAPVRECGVDNDDVIESEYGIARSAVKVARSRGKDRFAQLYVERYAPHWA